VVRPAPLSATLLALIVLLLAGCGGGGDDNGGGSDGGGSGGEPQAPVLGQGGDEEQAATDLGFPAFATRNTTRVGGADPIADAAAIAQAVYPSRDEDTRPRAVTLVDATDWRVGVSAAQLMAPPLRAPVLYTDGGELPAATEQALGRLVPTGAEEAGGAQVVRVGEAATAQGYKTTPVEGADYAALAQAIDRLQTAAAGKPSRAVVIASAEQPGFSMPAAGWAAKSGQPVLWTTKDSLPPETREAIRAHERPRIYVLGPEEAVAAGVVSELEKLGPTKRISAADPVTSAIAFARYSDGAFGWNVVDPGHGLVFVNAERTLDALAGAAFSGAGQFGPVLLVDDAAALPVPVQEYLLDIQPGYDEDPVRGVYNHGWLMGDEAAISADVQSRIDALLEIQPVDTESD
jgi:hypothetical protein